MWAIFADPMNEQPARPLVTRLRRVVVALPALAIGTTFAGMLAFSWGKWPDVLVDFGHELYAPWQLSEGKALGVDFTWGATGPLPPYLNALLFLIFGASLRVLVLFNLMVLAAITALLFALTRELSDRFAATLATVAFLAIFAFGQYVGIGNYNYVAPYSHGVTHGMLLSLAAIWLLRRHERLGGRRHALAAGAALGLVFLTKPELFVACAAAVGALWAASAWRRRSAREALRTLLLVAVPALAVPLSAFLLLLAQMEPATALRVTVTPWLLMATPLARTPFYLSGMGLDRPAENLATLARCAGWWTLVLSAAAALGEAARRVGAPRPLKALVAAGLGFVPLTLWLPLDAWFLLAMPFPLLVAGGAGAYAVRLLLRSMPEEDRSRAALGLALCAFAAGLLGKMILNARIAHYGFALAMPAALLVVVWLSWSAPATMERRRGEGTFLRWVALGLVLAAAVAHVRIAGYAFDGKTVEVGSGPDRFRADDRGEYVVEMIRRIDQVAAPGDTLAVIPEGVMVNFLTRRENPAPYLTYLPDAIAAFGEERMLAEYRRASPDLILLVHRDATEHGATYFGRDYARATAWWIAESYEPVALVGAPPNQGFAYGMMLLRRRAELRTR